MGSATFSFPDDDWRWLRSEAKASDMTVGELIRMLVRRAREGGGVAQVGLSAAPPVDIDSMLDDIAASVPVSGPADDGPGIERGPTVLPLHRAPARKAVDWRVGAR